MCRFLTKLVTTEGNNVYIKTISTKISQIIYKFYRTPTTAHPTFLNHALNIYARLYFMLPLWSFAFRQSPIGGDRRDTR